MCGEHVVKEMIIFSVVKSKRGVSKMEFVHNAGKLAAFTIKRCVNFPKRYTFFISDQLANMASEVYTNVIRANNIYAKNQHDAQIRIDFLVDARGLLYGLIAQIGIARELFTINDNVMEEWMTLINTEISLINGVIKNDRRKFGL